MSRKTSSPSEHFGSDADALYVTDDLKDRLDPESLTTLVPGGRLIRSSTTSEELAELEAGEAHEDGKFYEHELPKERARARLLFARPADRDPEPFALEGELVELSFGPDGWRVSLEVVSTSFAIELATLSSQALFERVTLTIAARAVVALSGKIDVSWHADLPRDTCSLSVSADACVPPT